MIGIRMILAGALLATAACAAGYDPPRQPSPDSISIGYGTRATRAVAGAVQTLKADARTAQYATIADMLQARVAGLQVVQTPDGQISLRLRGGSSIAGDNQPLLVINGQLISSEGVGSALLALSPSDVERIDILKDAGSAAIYGVRGSNGVIEIHTKRR